MTKKNDQNSKLAEENKRLRSKIKQLEEDQQRHEKTRNELKETRDHLQAILDAIPGSVSWIDDTYRYLGVNRVLAETFRKPAAYFIGKNVGFMKASSDFIDYVHDVFASSEPLPFKEIESGVDGHRMVHLIGSQKYHDGKHAVFVGIDITVRKLAEEVLRESEERYRSFVENLQGIAYRKNLDFSPIFFHGAVTEITGLTETDLINKDPEWRTLIYEEDLSVYSELLSYLNSENPSPRAFEYRIVSKENKIKWLREHVSVIRDGQSQKAFIQGTIYDITKQKEAEEALIVSEENYRKFFEEDLTGDYISTPDGILKFCNPAFADIFGFRSVKEALDFDLNNLYKDPETRNEFIKLIEKEGKLKITEVELKNRNGDPVFVVENVIGTFDKNNELIELRGYLFDITERKKLEDQVRQAQKMEAIGTLAGGIAHDFNNLLTTIQGYTDLAINGLEEADPLHRNLNQISRAANRASSLTNQLLLFSRKQSIELDAINVNDVIENLLTMLTRLIGEDIEIKVELNRECWNVWGDVGNLEQIIMNLVVNARDAMPRGGILTIRTENHIIDKKYCKIYNYAQPGRFLCLSIADTGIGMDPVLVQHIFEPFYTTKDAGKGTGLGLSVVYGIVKQHDGWINVHSEKGIGSTFEVFLPASTVKMGLQSGHTGNIDSIEGKGERILLIEDEDGIREFASNVLSMHGYLVMSCANSAEAEETFKASPENFDLIFSDVVLPDKDGVELVESIRKIRPDIKILLSSGYTDQKSQWPKIRSKGYHFLQKPYNLHDLLQFIAEVLK